MKVDLRTSLRSLASPPCHLGSQSGLDHSVDVCTSRACQKERSLSPETSLGSCTRRWVDAWATEGLTRAGAVSQVACSASLLVSRCPGSCTLSFESEMTFVASSKS